MNATMKDAARPAPHEGDRAGRYAAVFFAVLTVIGIAAGFGYGVPWDEPFEIEILRTNLNEYAVRLFGGDSELAVYYDSELPRESINKFAELLYGKDSEFMQYYSLSGVPMVSDTPNRDHGAAAYYLAAPILLMEGVSPRARMLLWHAYNFLWFMLGVVSVYVIAKDLTGSRGIGMAASLMLYLSPRLFAQGHYNNKDVVLLSLVIAMLCLGLKLMRRPGYRAGILFALLSAIATNTKIVGLWAFGITGLAVIAGLCLRRAMNARVALLGGVILACYAGFFLMLTPAAWGDVPGYISYVAGNAASFAGWDNYVLFRGSVFRMSENPLPWYYLPYMMLTTTPPYILALAAAGQVGALALCAGSARGRGDAQKAVFLGAVSLMWLVPLIFAAIRGINVYNGWRHFYFVYAGVLVMAAHGASIIARRFKKALALALCACFLITGVSMAKNHPYQYSYFSPAVSLRDVENDFELDYWNVSAMNALRALLSGEDGAVSISGVDIYSQYALEISAGALPRAERERLIISDYRDGTAEYALSNRSYRELSGWEPEGYERLVSIRAYGREIMAVYGREGGAR